MGQSKKSTAVITGAGVVCPIGIGVDSFWQSLMDGRSGIGPFPLLRETPMPVRFGGYIGDFEPTLAGRLGLDCPQMRQIATLATIAT